VRAVRVTAADSGSALCVRPGELVEVDLTAPTGTAWSVTEQGSSLRRMSTGVGTPGAGVAPVFEAVAPGTAYIRGTRRACATPATGAAACGAMEAYSVTVVVR
jgi:hypothetical protein